MGPRGRARAQNGIQRSGPRDRDRTVDIKRLGLMTVSGAAPAHGDEVAEAGASVGSRGSKVTGVGQDQ
jgi:hypothetical protein